VSLIFCCRLFWHQLQLPDRWKRLRVRGSRLGPSRCSHLRTQQRVDRYRFHRRLPLQNAELCCYKRRQTADQLRPITSHQHYFSFNPLTPAVTIIHTAISSLCQTGLSRHLSSASECPDVKNYKWRLNPVRHTMLYSCTHMATVGVKLKGLLIHVYLLITVVLPYRLYRPHKCMCLIINLTDWLMQ